MDDEERGRYERQIEARENLRELMKKDPTTGGVIAEALCLVTAYVNKYPDWGVNQQALIWAERAQLVMKEMLAEPEEIEKKTRPHLKLLDDDPQW